MLGNTDISQLLINGVVIFLGYVGKQVLAYVKGQRQRDEAYRAGIVALLRYHILKSAQEACTAGVITAEYRVNIQEMYSAYHGLGGNGVVTEWYNMALNLPIENPKK